MHGWTVRAFNDFEAALFWLSSGQETATLPAYPPPEKNIPIRTAKRKDSPAAARVALREGKEKPVRSARGSNNRL
jgi:hypothetical protein